MAKWEWLFLSACQQCWIVSSHLAYKKKSNNHYCCAKQQQEWSHVQFNYRKSYRNRENRNYFLLSTAGTSKYICWSFNYQSCHNKILHQCINIIYFKSVVNDHYICSLKPVMLFRQLWPVGCQLWNIYYLPSSYCAGISLV